MYQTPIPVTHVHPELQLPTTSAGSNYRKLLPLLLQRVCCSEDTARHANQFESLWWPKYERKFQRKPEHVGKFRVYDVHSECAVRGRLGITE